MEGAVNSWGAVYLSDITGAGPAVASLGYFAFSVTMIVVRLAADRIVERIGPVLFLRLAGVVALAGFVVVLAAPAPLAAVFGFALVGLGVAGVVPVAWSAAGRKQRDAPGRAVAAVAACGFAGFLVEPVIIGAIAGWAGLPWGLSTAMVAAAAVAFLARSLR